MNKIEHINNYKRKLFFLLFFCFLSVFSQKSDFLEEIFAKNGGNQPFTIGEELRYKISYGKKNKKKGILTAGNATFKIEKYNNNNYLLYGFGETTRMFSLFMKVKHEYKSIVDIKTLNALRFEMTIEEGKLFIKDSTNLNSNINLANSINDILSTFYKLRALPAEEIDKIDTLFFSYYYNGATIPSYIVKLGKEIVQTKFGEIKTTKWSPLLEKGRMFKETTGAFVWVTDNPMHIPIKIEFPILVGSIYVNLNKTKGTMNNLF